MSSPHWMVSTLAALALVGCSSSDIAPRLGMPQHTFSAPPAQNLNNGCVSNFSPDVDYFPDKVRVHHASQFSVSYHRHYKRLRFKPNVATEQNEEFLLVQCGTPVPTHDARTRVVNVPAQRFVLTNLAFVGAAAKMNLLPSLIGISSINGVSHPELIARHQRGLVKEIGSGLHSSVELAIAADTDLLFTFYSAWPNYNTHPKLWDVGIQGLPLADHFEQTPLGRTEWVKYLALFFNREQEANAIFEPVSERYRKMTTLSAAVKDRPQVLVGWTSGRDIWNLNGAKNFFAQLIRDAGGEYFWRDDLSLSLVPVDFETIYDQQSPTRFWVSRSFAASTRRQLAAINPTLSSFSAFQANAIFSPDKNTAVHRRPPWQDQSLDKPDQALADLIHMLHPELLPNHEPFFIRKVD